MHIRISEKTDLVLNKTYTTHMAVLMRLCQATEGPIMELGGGFFSTPLLHWLCSENRRKLVTYEDNHDFDGFLKSFTSRSHFIVHVDSWDEISLKDHWTIAFVDHGPVNGKTEMESRKESVLRLKDSVDYIVLHDTNCKECDDSFWSNFKYVYHWTWATPNTSIVSNFKEIKL